MSGVDLADRKTYSPTLSNLGLRTLGYQLDESDPNKYSPTWSKGLTEFCEQDDRIETLADRVAISLFADLYGRDGFRPHDKGEAEEFAEMLLDSGPWEQRLFEFIQWYLPVERRELFQTISIESNARMFELPVMDTGGPPLPYDELPPEKEVETVSAELMKWGAEATLGSDRAVDPTLPEVGVGLGRQLNEQIVDCDALKPNYGEDDRIVDTIHEAEDELLDNGYQPDLMLISGRTEKPHAVPAGVRTVRDKYLAPSEFILVDPDRFGFQTVRKDWAVDVMDGLHMGQRHIAHDPESTLGFRITSRQGTAVANEDAVFRGLLRP